MFIYVAKPVFCDVDKTSITINMENILKVYDDEVAAILITHTHLMNSDILEIVKFCKSPETINFLAVNNFESGIIL